VFGSQLGLDLDLTGPKPVHSPIEVTFIDPRERKHLPEGALVALLALSSLAQASLEERRMTWETIMASTRSLAREGTGSMSVSRPSLVMVLDGRNVTVGKTTGDVKAILKVRL